MQAECIDDKQKDSLISDLTEIMKLLTASAKTAKAWLKYMVDEN